MRETRRAQTTHLHTCQLAFRSAVVDLALCLVAAAGVVLKLSAHANEWQHRTQESKAGARASAHARRSSRTTYILGHTVSSSQETSCFARSYVFISSAERRENSGYVAPMFKSCFIQRWFEAISRATSPKRHTLALSAWLKGPSRQSSKHMYKPSPQFPSWAQCAYRAERPSSPPRASKAVVS